MNPSEEAMKIAKGVSDTYRDMVVDLSGAEAAHAHEHLIKHLQGLALMHRDQFAVQAQFAVQVLHMLMGRVTADGVDQDDPAGRDCARANAFVVRVVKVMAGALGVGS